MNQPVYECTYPGCRHQEHHNNPPPIINGKWRHIHISDRGVLAYVEMRKRNFPRNSRTDSFAGNGKGKNFNQYSE